MLGGVASGCINHSAVEAVARCKQCGKPVCGQCVVKGPTGSFCSEECQQKNELFTKKAQDLEKKGKLGPGAASGGGSIIGKLVALVIFLVIAALASAYLNIPVIGPIVRQWLPFLPAL